MRGEKHEKHEQYSLCFSREKGTVFCIRSHGDRHAVDTELCETGGGREMAFVWGDEGGRRGECEERSWRVFDLNRHSRKFRSVKTSRGQRGAHSLGQAHVHERRQAVHP
jgi:hypothetical protein